MSVKQDYANYTQAFMNGDHLRMVTIEKRHNLYGYPESMVHAWLYAEMGGPGKGNEEVDRLIGAAPEGTNPTEKP
jgi:hypothetical protein